jgi:hypothetical protein
MPIKEPREPQIEPTLKYRVVTAFGDQFLTENEPDYRDHSVYLASAYHVTDAGWHGQRKQWALPAAVVRYVEYGAWLPFGPFPRFGPPLSAESRREQQP